MFEQQAGLSIDAKQLREAFDQDFARAVVTESAHWQDFLQIRLGDVVHMLALDEVACLQPMGWVTPVPSALPTLLGIMGHKGEIVPVYDLRLVLDRPAAAAPRWMVISHEPAVALAFDSFDQHLRCDVSAVAKLNAGTASGEQVPSHIQAHLQMDGQAWPLVSLTSVIDSIQYAARQCAQRQES